MKQAGTEERVFVQTEPPRTFARVSSRAAGRKRFLTWGLILLCALVASCQREREEQAQEQPQASDGVAGQVLWEQEDSPSSLVRETSSLLPPAERGGAGDSADVIGELTREAERCRSAIERAREKPGLPGAKHLESQRAQVLLRVRSEPVFFIHEPPFSPALTPGIAVHQRSLKQYGLVRERALTLLRNYQGNYEVLRRLFLRSGYFFMDDGPTARELFVRLRLEHLFIEPELVLERGEEQWIVRRTARQTYEFASGPHKGQSARLFLFDRVWVQGEEPGPPLHVDVRKFVAREGVEGLRVDHLGEQELVAELRFAEEWVPALLKREGTQLSLTCLLVEPDAVERVGAARERAYRRALVLDALRAAMIEQVQWGLPFDEPKTEVGQQDGALRPRFERAYASGKTEYTFNRDKYPVFGAQGQPLTPQVCIDFITETFELASGMRYPGRGEPPEKVRGAIDFDELLGSDRRREIALRDYAREQPHRFQLRDFQVSARVRYEQTASFFRFIEAQKDWMQTGDIVIIRGRSAWDFYRELHTHTFFVYESDPLSGAPLLLAGNSGRPRILTWDEEMLRSPKRSIQHLLRPNWDWLYEHIVQRTPLRGERWAVPLQVDPL